MTASFSTVLGRGRLGAPTSSGTGAPARGWPGGAWEQTAAQTRAGSPGAGPGGPQGREPPRKGQGRELGGFEQRQGGCVVRTQEDRQDGRGLSPGRSRDAVQERGLPLQLSVG